MIRSADIYASFKAHTDGATTFTRRTAINMADWFQVSPRSIIRRLESLWIIPDGSGNWFEENGGITREHIEEARKARAALDQKGGEK